MQFHVWIRQNLTAIQLAKHSVFSVIIFVLVQLIDRRTVPWIDIIPAVLKTPQSLSQTMLASLAAALLTITTFSFASILTLLNHYSSNYSPRIVENILNRNSVMNVVGMNAGGFLYSILALAFGAETSPAEPVTAGMVAAMYSVACIIYFIYFVHGVAIRVKPSYIIDSLFREAETAIAQAAAKPSYSVIDSTISLLKSIPIYANSNGFFEGTDFTEIFDIFNGKTGQLDIVAPIGDHLGVGDILGSLSLTEPINESDLASVAECFQITQEKDVSFDYHFGVTKLVEIAMRAISPAVNDPNTAIHCIYQIGTLTGHIAGFRDGTPTRQAQGRFEILQIERTLWQELNQAYEQLIHYGRNDISIIRALFQALQITYDHALSTNRPIVAEFEQYLFDSVSQNFPQPIDQAKITWHRLKTSNK